MSHPNTHSLGGIVLDYADGSRVVTASPIDKPADVRLALDEKSQQDGQWDAQPQLGGKVMPLVGFCEEATPEDAQALVDNLRALSRQLVEFTVDSPARGTRSAMVRVQSGFDPEWIDDVAFTYTITVIAPDPLLYGPQVFAQTSLASVAGGTGRVWPRVWPTDWGVPPGVTPGAITVANAGTASYFPRLRIDGPVKNPVVSLVETGDVVRFKGTIAAGQHLDINWGTPRRATLGGSDPNATPINMRHKVSYTGNWLAVPVGGGSISYTADDADPAALLSVWSYEGAWE
jgi:hypothetical protein